MHEILPIAGIPDIRGYIKSMANPIVLVIEPGHAEYSGLILRELYGFRVGAERPYVEDIIHDFMEYEQAAGRDPCAVMFKGLRFQHAHTQSGEDLLQQWAVISVDEEASSAILRLGRIGAPEHLRSRGLSYRPIGKEQEGEPVDYADLINLTSADDLGPELLVASKEHESACDEDQLYHPGTRIYFRVDELKQQPNYTRFMGCHAIRDKLLLDSVTHLAITSQDLGAPAGAWTPKTFTDAANQAFMAKLEAIRQEEEEAARKAEGGFLSRLFKKKRK